MTYISSIKLINPINFYIMKPRIFNTNIPQPIKKDTPLRRLFERYNGCKASVKLELERMEMKGQKLVY
jgi:hypothetical protein